MRYFRLIALASLACGLISGADGDGAKGCHRDRPVRGKDDMMTDLSRNAAQASPTYSGTIPCRSPGRPPSAVAFTSPSAKRSRIRVPGFIPAAWVIGVPDGSVTKA